MTSLRARGPVAGLLAALVLGAAPQAGCSVLTGASAYVDTTSCTGAACALQCKAQGGTIGGSGECTCPGGGPLCDGICCGGTAAYCVTTREGGRRCSACTDVAYECGAVCCERQVCLSASLGACGAPYGVEGQSCTGGLSCPVVLANGSTAGADCCESIALPGGPFEMGRNEGAKNRCPTTDVAMGEECNIDELPAHRVVLAPYRLDRFEVTVSRFRKFVDAWDYLGLPEGAGGDAVVAGSGWQSQWSSLLPKSRADIERDLECKTDELEVMPLSVWTPAPGFYEHLPVNCVTWYEAFAFCVWDGGRLPTEAEWEFAAANGPAADLYPWGEAVPTSASAVYNCASDAVPCSQGPPFQAPVGSKAIDVNQWGHRDLAGNVQEWVLDSVGPYPSMAVTNYANTADDYRLNRGAGYASTAVYLRAASRTAEPPLQPLSTLGIRCARNP
jgi:sulfatase modifying factor 1